MGLFFDKPTPDGSRLFLTVHNFYAGLENYFLVQKKKQLQLSETCPKRCTRRYEHIGFQGTIAYIQTAVVPKRVRGTPRFIYKIQVSIT